MRVALVTSEGRCGIAEHSAMLVQYVQAADPSIVVDRSSAAWLDPLRFAPPSDTQVVHLNYHRALHSRWTPERVAALRPWKTVVTFHDTYEVQPDRLPWDLLDVCDALVVHEPCDLQSMPDVAHPAVPDVPNPKVHYWRQGVPEPSGLLGHASPHRSSRPIVGTCGFAFPWKGFELLCDAAAQVGWGVAICSHNATPEQEADWQARNPWVSVRRQYDSTEQLIANLAACDATAFLYGAQNSGTSGAIRLGIAAGKPLLATLGCRQFRDLVEDNRASAAIGWVRPNAESIAHVLSSLFLERFDADVVALRERDSWRHLGAKYAALYRSLVTP